MAFTDDYRQRKRKYEKQNLKREVELDEEYAEEYTGYKHGSTRRV